MKKLFLVLFLFACSDFSNFIERKGYVQPEFLKSKSFYVHFAGFNFKYRLNKKIDLQYAVTIKFYDTLNIDGKYIIIDYPDPQKKNNKTQQQVVLIDKKEKILNLTSSLIYTMKQYDVYNLRIRLTKDQYGHQVTEEINQRVRVDCIPSGFKNEL